MRRPAQAPLIGLAILLFTGCIVTPTPSPTASPTTRPSRADQVSSAVVRRCISGLAGFLNCCGMK